MRLLNEMELVFVAGGQDGCPPARSTDVIDCAQSDYGNAVNDATNLLGNAYEAAVEWTSDAIETVAGWF